MLKRIAIVFLALLGLFCVSYFSHNAINTEVLSFSLLQVYLYFAISTLIIYGIIEFVAEHLPAQAGYAYLMFMLFKIGIFILIFQDSVLTKDVLTKADKVGLVLPLFLFLMAEAIAVGKLLNSK